MITRTFPAPRAAAHLLLVGVLSVAGCSSDDDDDDVDGGIVADDAEVSSIDVGPLGSPNAAFEIQPEDVDAYVAEYEEAAARARLELDGEAFPAPPLLESEDGLFFFELEDGVLALDLSSVDPSTGEELPRLTYYEGNLEGVESFEEFLAIATRTLAGEDLDVQETPEGDTVFTGRLVDIDTAEETDVRFVLNSSLSLGGDTSLVIDGTDAVLSGALGTSTYVQLRELITTEPGVERLVLTDVQGSVNDDINLHSDYLVREAGLDTFIPADGDVNSGGTDLFLAGTERVIEDGAIYGVHAWASSDGVSGADIPRDDPAHDPFLTYMLTMLGDTGPDFYYFTLDAAPPGEIEPMTRDEIVEFGVVTR